MRALAVLLILIPLSLTPALATGPGPFEHDASVGPGALAGKDYQLYVELQKGETAIVTLTWDDPVARLSMTTGVGKCAPGVPSCVPYPDCRYRADGTSPLRLTHVALRTGLHRVDIIPAVAATPVPFHVQLAVGDGGAERVVDHGLSPGFSAGAAPFVACSTLG